jgi:tRNA dimethylallyltransferase
MIRDGAAEEARRAAEAGASRTVRAALGFEQLLADHDGTPSPESVAAIKAAHRAYARRQLTWMRKMEDINLIVRTAGDDREIAGRIVDLLDAAG